jgi:hypothetical protein
MMARRVQTSKILLFAWLGLAVPLFLLERLDEPRLILWLAGLGCLVWNRVDSRGKAYRFELRGPQGTGVSVRTGDGGPHDG